MSEQPKCTATKTNKCELDADDHEWHSDGIRRWLDAASGAKPHHGRETMTTKEEIAATPLTVADLDALAAMLSHYEQEKYSPIGMGLRNDLMVTLYARAPQLLAMARECLRLGATGVHGK